jgi:hypothetical protein
MSIGRVRQALTAARTIYEPPSAETSLRDPRALIMQAQELESMARTEMSLDDNGGRDRFWRAAAALRFTARLLSYDPDLVALYCQAIDNDRGRS